MQLKLPQFPKFSLIRSGSNINTKIYMRIPSTTEKYFNR